MDFKKIVSDTKDFINDYEDGYLEADLGYKFHTRKFLNVAFLYMNSVDVENPDLLGYNNKNTFVYEIQSETAKIKEQIRLDIKDLNFLVESSNSLSRFIPKAANRKILEENDFAVVLDEVPDNAVDFGSGFLKVWESDGKLKLRSIDPMMMYFDQYNFAKGKKGERFRTTARKVIDNEKYDVDARTMLRKNTSEDDMDKALILYQIVEELPNDKQRVYVVDIENELVYLDYETKDDEEKIISYYKFDFEKRKGFPDALGKGALEKVFNKLVQSKVNRKRLDEVMEIASKLTFQKQIDNERDNLVGEDITELDNGVIVGHKGNPMQLLDTGGTKQIQLIQSQLDALVGTIGTDLNMTEALTGNTLPSGTSGVLGNLLTENASSVFKDIKENYAKFIDRVYRDRIIKYILSLFDSKEDLRKHLDPSDIKIVERGVRDYYIVQEYIDKEIEGEVFNLADAKERAKQKVKKGKIISGELLQELKEDAQGIRTFISGENISKPQIVAFLRELRNTYIANPAVFQDPFFINMIKKEAEYDSGISGLEIDLLIQTLQESAGEAL